MTSSPWSDDGGRGGDTIGSGGGDRNAPSDFIVTTTNGIDGRPVQRYLGMVTGEVIVGANLFRDLFASIRDIVGGRAGAYEEVLARAREQALGEMRARAATLGANAVIGVDLDYQVIGSKGSMLMVSATGTAVYA